jgi:Kef-type K+ transport system membrane component KefB
MAVAIAGKFVGTFIGAWLHGVEARQMTALGTLMNTRGLTELVIVTVGLQLGVVDHGLYSQMVVMAVVTTAMTGILLQLIYPRRLVQRDVEQEFSVGAVHGKSPKIAP